MVTFTCWYLNVCFTYLVINSRVDFYAKKGERIEKGRTLRNAFIYCLIFASVCQLVVYLLYKYAL